MKNNPLTQSTIIKKTTRDDWLTRWRESAIGRWPGAVRLDI